MAAKSDRGRHRRAAAGEQLDDGAPLGAVGVDVGTGTADVDPGKSGGAWTRTAGEWIGGIIRSAVFLGVVGVVVIGLFWLAANTVHRQFGQYVPVPAIPAAVPLGGGIILGLAAGGVYAIVMRPKRAVDRVSGRDGSPQVGGRVWPGPGADGGDGGADRHGTAVTR